jgi:hypothetical protein
MNSFILFEIKTVYLILLRENLKFIFPWLILAFKRRNMLLQRVYGKLLTKDSIV